MAPSFTAIVGVPSCPVSFPISTHILPPSETYHFAHSASMINHQNVSSYLITETIGLYGRVQEATHCHRLSLQDLAFLFLVVFMLPIMAIGSMVVICLGVFFVLMAIVVFALLLMEIGCISPKTFSRTLYWIHDYTTVMKEVWTSSRYHEHEVVYFVGEREMLLPK